MKAASVWHCAIRAVGVLAMAVVLADGATAQLTTGSFRGRVTDQQDQPVAGAQVSAIHQETGVTTRIETTADGRYQLIGLPVGLYTLRVRRIGFQPMEQRDLRVRLGETVDFDFQMIAAPMEIDEILVTAVAQPLIDRTQHGKVDLIGSEAVDAIPVNGRNFADLVALSPSVAVNVGDGSGGNLSIGGGRRGANLIQIDGAGSTGTFFGGEARGSDRIPFAYSIETVKEFQIVTNAYDVEYGFFAGGLINAVTKSGTNEFRGQVFGYFRNDGLTGDDFFGRTPSEFSSRQIGFALSGPLVRDRAHFHVNFERQDRDEPIFGLPAPGTLPTPDVGIHPDSVQRFLDILRNVYGVTDTPGRFTQNQDETAIFARVDWQLSDRHRLTLRHNFTDLEQLNDRISSNELRGNGGIFENRGNSTVLEVNSILSPVLINEFRAQRATEPRPRKAFSLIPEATVDITSDFGAAGTRRLTAECCNDAVLPNNLEESTWEFVDNLHFRTGAHALKFGANLNIFSFENFFFFRQQGRYRFRSLADFAAGRARDFQRALPNPGPDGEYFTDDDVIPLALYDVREFSVYGQDQWDVTDRLNLLLGLRLDNTSFPDKAPLNAGVRDTFGLRTDVAPGKTNFSPRLGFTYDLHGDGRRLVRGGVGRFAGRFPAVLYSNSLLNSGLNQEFIICSGSRAPQPIGVYSGLQNLEPGSREFNKAIPSACVGTGIVGSPNINLFSPEFEYPKSWKANLGFEQAVGEATKVGVDVVYSKTTDNFYVVDRNLLGEQFRSGIENRPMFTPVSGIRSDGSLSFGANRITSVFNDVLEHISPAESRLWQVTFRLEKRPTRTSNFGWQASYTYSNSEDNASYSCCISSTAIFETPTAGDHRFLGKPGDRLRGSWGPSEFDRRHTIVLSGIARLPWAIELSGIWRMVSGAPWTPTVDGDVNADGRDDNDRAYVGTNLNFTDPSTALPLLQQHLDEWDCLAEQVGHIAKRNSCRNPWFRSLDLRIRRAFGTVRGQEVEVVADFFNVGNFIDSDWGRNVGVSQFGSARELLVVDGFDAATQTYRYSVNPSFGQLSDMTPFRTDQFQMQLGVRYRFRF